MNSSTIDDLKAEVRRLQAALDDETLARCGVTHGPTSRLVTERDAAVEEAALWENTAVSESEAKDVARKWSRMWKAEAKILRATLNDFQAPDAMEKQVAEHMRYIAKTAGRIVDLEAERDAALARAHDAESFIALNRKSDESWAIVIRERDAAVARAEKAEAMAERYRVALKWYADPVTHTLDDANGYYPDAGFPIHDDNGDRARAALAEEKP
ncbi:MAG: hypothetical protein H0U59_01215 [Gemmatimonadaceae bacterium]|nr:hypothetical protein [Gemmatimonadaceae bacterium]